VGALVGAGALASGGAATGCSVVSSGSDGRGGGGGPSFAGTAAGGISGRDVDAARATTVGEGPADPDVTAVTGRAGLTAAGEVEGVNSTIGVPTVAGSGRLTSAVRAVWPGIAAMASTSAAPANQRVGFTVGQGKREPTIAALAPGRIDGRKSRLPPSEKQPNLLQPLPARHPILRLTTRARS
jgi:hypothetical protein